jgi:PAS domain S-box-containing protein
MVMIRKNNLLAFAASLAVVLSLISLILLIKTTSTQQRNLLEEAAYRGIERGLIREEERMGSVARDFAWWDDTISNSIISPNMNWVEKNLGNYLHKNFNIQYLSVLTPEFLPLYQFTRSRLSNIPLELPKALNTLLKDAANREYISDDDGPSIASGIVEIHGKVMIVAASRLMQEDDEFDLESHGDYILLLGQELNGPLLERIKYDLNLDELNVAPLVQENDHHNHDGVWFNVLDIHKKQVAHLDIKVPVPEQSISIALYVALIILGLSSILTLVIAFRTIRTLKERNETNATLLKEVSTRKKAEFELSNLQKGLKDEVVERTQQLADEQSRLLSIFNASADGIITINSSKVIESLNPAVTIMLGYSESELINKPIKFFLSPQSYADYVKLMGRCKLDSQSSLSCHLEVYHKGGKCFIVDLSIAPIQGQAEKFVSVMRDISDHVQLERAREDAIDELRDVIETAAEGFVRFDNLNVITEVNDAFCQMLGIQKEDILQKEFRSLVHPDYLEIFDSHEPIGNPSALRSYELKLKTSIGEGYFFLKTTTIVSNQTNSLSYFAFVSDITETYRYQDKLRTAIEEAERANLAKSEFLSSMSHELRTPLNAILGFTQLLENSRKDPLSDRQKVQVNHILMGGRHLLSLVNDVLDLARIEVGEVSLSLERIEPLRVLNDCIDLVRGLADAKEITLKTIQRDEELPSILADYTRLKQTLINLINNGIKYNQPNGLVEVELSSSGNYLRFSVRDTGIGISEDQQANLFKPFSRLGNENSDIEGTGIGLIITRKLVEQMGGEIGFKSETGVGSVFWITIPIATNLNGTLELEDNIEKNIKKRTRAQDLKQILYIEDNPANQELMQFLLDDDDRYQLVLSSTAEDGIEYAIKEKPDFIFMDINLPGMSGLDALVILKSNESTSNIPIVAISANAMESMKEKGLEKGFDHYLTKPIDLKLLLSTLDSYF